MTIRTGIKRIYGKNAISRQQVLKVAKSIRKNSVRQLGPITTVKSGQSNIQLIEKMDGSFCRFGVDDTGLFFLQSSNSPPANVNNFKKVFKALPDFRETFDCLMQLKSFQKWCLDLFNSVGKFAVSAEIFPLLTHTGDNDSVVFCGTKYSKHNFGSKGAFVTFDIAMYDVTSNSYISVGKDRSEKLQYELHDLSNQTFGSIWKIMPNHIYCYLNREIAFNLVQLDTIVDNDESYEAALQMLRSTRKTKERAALVSKIECGRKSLQRSLDKFADELKSFLSDGHDSAEGVILSLDIDGALISLKGTSNAFDLTKKRLWHHRQEYLKIDRKIDSIMLQTHFGFTKTTPVALNKRVRSALENFKPGSNGEEEFYLTFLAALKPPLHFSFKNFGGSVETFREIREGFESLKHEFDCDTIRKTYEIQNRVLTRVLHLEQLDAHTILSAEQQVELLRDCLGRRISRLVNFEVGDGIPQDELNRAIVWVGRAQPWHKGHHNMITECLKNLEATGCDKVVILLVHGYESSKNDIENPLSFEAQLNVLYTLYGDDDRIVICNSYLRSAYIANVLSALHQLSMRLGGWICGPDRVPTYTESLRQFSVEQFLLTHSYCPMSKDKLGNPCVEFLHAERIFSGTESRRLSGILNFDDWFLTTVNLCENAMTQYKEVYERLRVTRGKKSQNTSSVYMLPTMG
jgi:hypothetical protein